MFPLYFHNPCKTRKCIFCLVCLSEFFSTALLTSVAPNSPLQCFQGVVLTTASHIGKLTLISYTQASSDTEQALLTHGKWGKKKQLILGSFISGFNVKP